MTFAVERLTWRFDAYHRMVQACARGNVSPARFLGVSPERLRLRFGESFRQSQVPIVFAPDLADRLGALLPSPGPAEARAPALDRDTLRGTLALAQLDGDLDVLDVLGWTGRSALLETLASFYAQVFDEARSSGSGEETAALFGLVAQATLRNVLLHKVGASGRFLGLGALVAYLDDRALAASTERHGEGLSARLGLLLVAACSPLALMGVATAVSERPANAYRTLPTAFARARRAVRERLDQPGALDLIALRSHLAAGLLVDPSLRQDLERALQAEAIRDCALLSTLTQGSDLRDLAGQSAVLTEALFSPLGPTRLKERLARHPSAGQGALGRLSLLLDSLGVGWPVEAERRGLFGSVEERATLAATGALVLALDEVALEQGAEALAAVRPVPEQEAREAREDGRAYWFGFDGAPLYQLPRRRHEAFIFVDMKDFTRRTVAVHSDAMGDFLATRFYNPILRVCGHLGRNPRSRVKVVNLLGDAVAARGDILSMIELSMFVLRQIDDAARELAQSAERLRSGADEVLSEIELELTHTDEALARLLEASPEREELVAHRRDLIAGRDQRLAKKLGGGLEGSAFIAWGAQATTIAVGSPDVGDWQVTIAEHLNMAARGTGRSAALARKREELRRRDEAAAGTPLVDPFRVHTSSDPELLTPSTEFHNTGAALTAEALAAYQSARARELRFQPLTVRAEALRQGLPGFWFPRAVEQLMLAFDGSGLPVLILRFTGRTVFRGLESLGATEVWEIVPVDGAFGRALTRIVGGADGSAPDLR